MTDLVDHLKAQSLSEKGIALSDVSHDYGKLVLERTGIGVQAAPPMTVSLLVLQTFQRSHQRIHLGFSIVEGQGRAHRCL